VTTDVGATRRSTLMSGASASPTQAPPWSATVSPPSNQPSPPRGATREVDTASPNSRPPINGKSDVAHTMGRSTELSTARSDASPPPPTPPPRSSTAQASGGQWQTSNQAGQSSSSPCKDRMVFLTPVTFLFVCLMAFIVGTAVTWPSNVAGGVVLDTTTVAPLSTTPPPSLSPTGTTTPQPSPNATVVPQSIGTAPRA
jgi:hypothetical protein